MRRNGKDTQGRFAFFGSFIFFGHAEHMEHQGKRENGGENEKNFLGGFTDFYLELIKFSDKNERKKEKQFFLL